MNVIPFNVPYTSGKELDYIKEVFENGHFSGNGPFTKRAQEWLESYLGAPRVLLTNSCTAALEISAMMNGLGPGDEVLMPSFTFTTTASSIMRCGATPVFCEIVPESMLIDLSDAAKRITPRTKAIVPVHYAGIATNMEKVLMFAGNNNLAVIEDSAQGLGSTWNGSHLATFAPLAGVSFHETKNIHSGLGGCVVINDPKLVEKAEIVWERGTDRSAFLKGIIDKYSWREVGSSFYPSELQAAFLFAQLESLEDNLTLRRRLWQEYRARISEISGKYDISIIEPEVISHYNAHMFAVVLRTPREADFVRKELNDVGIQAVIHYVPLHASPMGKKLGYSEEDLPETLFSAGSLLRLPMHHRLSPGDIDRVVVSLGAALEKSPKFD
jgi:dTDP-4-amino-4,6-dideoxygalactose transaminase